MRRARLRRQAILEWERTGNVRARKRAGVHGRAMRKLQGLIELRTEPKPISARGLKFIADFEGFRATPYNDPALYATVGIGHLIGLRPVQPSDLTGVWVKGQATPGRLTEREARQLLRTKMAERYEPAVRRLFVKGGYLYGKYTRGRYEALCSFAMNLGPGSVTPGTPGFETIGRAIRDGDLRAIANAMPLYAGSSAGRLPGLVSRRAAERRLFLTGKYL